MEARRIRIFFSDPDATDSDSGDDPTSGVCAPTKSAGKTELVILQCNSRTNTNTRGAKMNPAGAGCGRPQAIRSLALPAAGSSRNRAVGSAPTTRRHRGVYERQPGRWAAEFRSHRLKVRHWVGTFATEEEAKAAYDAFERQFRSSPRPRCGTPASPNSGCVRRASHPPPDEKQQIVLALTAAATTRMLPPPSAGATMAASVCVPSAPPCIFSSTWASSPPTLFRDERRRDDAPRSLHSIWADEPADEDIVGLADLAHLPLPRFSDASMDFDPADLSLFDNGFL